MALSTDTPRDLVDHHRYGVCELHVPATNVAWKAGEIVGMNLSTGIAGPLATAFPLALGHVPQNAGRDLTAAAAGAERIYAQAGPIVVPQDGSFAADAAVGLPVYWDSTANEAVNTDNSGANPFLGDLVRAPSDALVQVDVRMANSLRAAVGATVEAAVPAAAIQAGTDTLVNGTKAIATATITASSRIIVTMKDPGAGAITGFADFDVPAASRVVGAPGSFTVNAIDDAKATIATAVCTFDWLVINL